MSDTDKNETKDVSEDELFVKEGDIVWNIPDKCICEVTSVNLLSPKPFIYLTRIAGCGFYNSELSQDGIELLLPKEQLYYEVITSENTIKAFYKGKTIMNIVFDFKKFIPIVSCTLNSVKRNYICKQLLEMYPDTKISETIATCWY